MAAVGCHAVGSGTGTCLGSGQSGSGILWPIQDRMFQSDYPAMAVVHKLMLCSSSPTVDRKW